MHRTPLWQHERRLFRLSMVSLVISACGVRDETQREASGTLAVDVLASTQTQVSPQPASVSDGRVKARVLLDDASIQAFLKFNGQADIIQKAVELVPGDLSGGVVSHQTESKITFLFGILPPLQQPGATEPTTTSLAASSKVETQAPSSSTTIVAVDPPPVAELAVTDILEVERIGGSMSSLNAKTCWDGDTTDWNLVAVLGGEENIDDRGAYLFAQRAWRYDKGGLHEIDPSKVTCELVSGD